MPAPPHRPPIDLEGVLHALRTTEEGPEKERAWTDFVRWLHDEHYAVSLQARLRWRIEGQGMLTHFAPCDVFSAYCLRVRSNPALLGNRSVPSRTWLRRQLDSICRELERRTRRREKARVHPKTGDEMTRLLEAATRGGGGKPAEEALASPEGAAMLRDLETEIRTHLATLEREHPDQYTALTLGAAGAPYSKIAAVLETTTGTVKSLVHRARSKLRSRLEGYLGS